MSIRQYTNAPVTTLAASITNSVTSITVVSTTGLPITFPYVLIIDKDLATEEAVEVTASTGTLLTVTRGIDGTTAFAHDNGATVAHGITARDIREANTHINTATGVHGIAGGSSVVGTTDAQTLSNKTLTTPILSVPVIASFASAGHNHINSAGGGQLTDAALSAAVTVPKGGTGLATLTAGRFLVGAGASAVDLTKVVPSGAVVGDTDAQTLTNKSLNLSSNTLSGTTAQFNSALSDGDFATLAGAETLTNKTLTAPAISNPTITAVPLVDNTGLGITAAAGWTIANFDAWSFGPLRTISARFTYSGATLTGSAQGNINDNALLNALLPAAWRPADSAIFAYMKAGVTFGTGTVTATGQIFLQTLVPSATINSGDDVLFTITYGV